MKISVTAEDIQNGKPGQTHSCAIALAVQRALPDPYLKAYVSNWYITIHTPGFTVTDKFKLSNEMDSFIRNYDWPPEYRCSNAIQPFDFELKLSYSMRTFLLFKKMCMDPFARLLIKWAGKHLQ